MGFREVLNIAEKFAVAVDEAPKTLDCRHQNRPMREVVKEKIDLRTFPEVKERLNRKDRGLERSGLMRFKILYIVCVCFCPDLMISYRLTLTSIFLDKAFDVKCLGY